MAMPWHPMWATDPFSSQSGGYSGAPRQPTSAPSGGSYSPYGNPGNPMGAPTQPSQSSGGAYLPYGNPTNPMGAPSAPHQGTGGAAGSNNPTGAPSAPGTQQSTTSAPWHPLNAVDQSYQGGYGGYQGYGGYGGYGGYQGYQGYQAPTPYNPSYQGGQSSAPPSYLASSLNQTFGAQAPSPSPTPPPGFGGIYNSGSNGNPGPRPTSPPPTAQPSQAQNGGGSSTGNSAVDADLRIASQSSNPAQAGWANTARNWPAQQQHANQNSVGATGGVPVSGAPGWSYVPGVGVVAQKPMGPNLMDQLNSLSSQEAANSRWGASEAQRQASLGPLAPPIATDPTTEGATGGTPVALSPSQQWLVTQQQQQFNAGRGGPLAGAPGWSYWPGVGPMRTYG